MEPGVPERLVDVDVPEPGQRPLVEQRGLQRGAATFQPLAQALRREGCDERLLAEARAEVRLELARLEQQPGAEAPDIAVGDLAAVVERQQRAPVWVACERICPQRAGHAEVDQQRAARRETDDQVLAAAIDVLDTLADQLRRDEERVLGPGQADVADLDVLEPPALERRRDRAPNGLDLGKLRHAARVATRLRQRPARSESRQVCERRQGALRGRRAGSGVLGVVAELVGREDGLDRLRSARLVAGVDVGQQGTLARRAHRA